MPVGKLLISNGLGENETSKRQETIAVNQPNRQEMNVSRKC